MKRTPLNRGSSQLARKPIKRKVGRTRDTPESLQLRRDYATANPTCEVTAFLKKHPESLAWQRSLRPFTQWDRGVETEHIWGGSSGRLDLWSMLIRVNPWWHEWKHANQTAGMLLFIIVKANKKPPEINDAEFCRCSGRAGLAGWLAMDDTIAACPTWLDPYRLRLVESIPSA